MEQGMTVIALLTAPDSWERGNLLGWIDISDNTIVCEDPARPFYMSLVLLAFFAVLWLRDAPAAWSGSLVLALVLGGTALLLMYQSLERLLIKRCLRSIFRR